MITSNSSAADFDFHFPYEISEPYSKRIAYFSMEFAIHQPLKLYAGGLGFLAGSHMRSAFELKQNLVGVGILWKYGYYDQVRTNDQSMEVLFQEKVYGLLTKTGIIIDIEVAGHQVKVGVYYLPPKLFNTAPLFLLTTDIEENDYLARTISHRLYDPNPETKLASAILLGVGGAKLLDRLNWVPEVYHMNESHGLPVAFYLYRKFNDLKKVRQHLVFTNHTTEASGNEKTDLRLLERMGYLANTGLADMQSLLTITDHRLDHTYTALVFAGKANGVSKMHHMALQQIWQGHPGICPIISITNAQNWQYWADKEMYAAVRKKDIVCLKDLKRARKHLLFEEVADQCGDYLDAELLTIVFAKRFAGYKRADLLLRDMDRFEKLVTGKQYPVQIIWAGKPYPGDYPAISIFNRIVELCKRHPNCAILCGYELKLSKLLKNGADIWLNVPRITHEASGTSGMSAAMNGAINLSTPDGWFPEFANDKQNAFVLGRTDPSLPEHEMDDIDCKNLYDYLENYIVPHYYEDQQGWTNIMVQSMLDVVPRFDSNRMVAEYYNNLYSG
ncbi:alpha-glucan family phosphorylase [Flavitalea antarctica]